MQVFSFWDSSDTRPTVDVMLEPGATFGDLWADASVINIGGHEWVTFEDAEALRRWSFERRTPEQRLACDPVAGVQVFSVA